MQEIGQAGAVLLVLMILLGGFIVLSANGGSIFPMNKSAATKNIYIRDLAIAVEEARTAEEHTRGLTGRDGLARRNGMLFYFEEPARWRVTTRGMQFPIDIFWIDANRIIVGIQKYAPANSSDIFEPPVDIKYILEVNADFADIYNIRKGDRVLGI